jgi:hypothetical protein
MKNRAHLFLLCNVISSLLVGGDISAMEQEPIEQASPGMSPRLLSPHLPGPGPSPFEPTGSQVLVPKVFEQYQVAVEQDSPLCNVPYNVLCTICKYLVNPCGKSDKLSDIYFFKNREYDLAYYDPDKDPEYIYGWRDINTLMATCRYLHEKMPQIMIDNHQGLLLDFYAKRCAQTQPLAAFFDGVFKRISTIAKRYHTIPLGLILSSNIDYDDTRIYEGDLPETTATVANFFQRLKDAGIAERIIYLHLSDNNLIFWPQTLSFLTNLKALNLSNNHFFLPISSLSDPLTMLALEEPLDEQDLRNNHLSCLPANITYLDVSSNYLMKSVIKYLASLKKLSILNVSHNPLTIGQLGWALGQKDACPALRLMIVDGLADDRTEEEQQYCIELHDRGVELHASS